MIPPTLQTLEQSICPRRHYQRNIALFAFQSTRLHLKPLGSCLEIIYFHTDPNLRSAFKLTPHAHRLVWMVRFRQAPSKYSKVNAKTSQLSQKRCIFPSNRVINIQTSNAVKDYPGSPLSLETYSKTLIQLILGSHQPGHARPNLQMHRTL